ncbi:histidine phosphatase family protein [Pseudomonas sp. NPDC089569]|uniref:lipopolysaccharide core heptose(II)-phosphate phosphatase PmrG n=1 Tax=Pseudomonas sp. NPDC089569 TaxID=3390722 RepID=UPI003D0833B5
MKSLLAGVGTLLVAAVVTGFVLWPDSPVHLVNADPQVRGRFLQHWADGDVVVLVRHAERCDRSSNPCLGPADGITRAGSDAAALVGQGLQQLGMAQTEVFSSPMTRTVQTAHSMFGKDAQTQDWLASCGSSMSRDVVAHKRMGHNLVLVTHSNCISDFEAQTGFEHAKTSEYGSALFVVFGADGQLQPLGIVNADDWSSMLVKRD